jgi:hypothetical protein
MLRKITHITVALMLLITTMGFTVSEHFCGDDLIKTTINAEAESCCGTEDGCCHNETNHYQLEENYVSQMVVFDLLGSGIDILFPIDLSSIQIEPAKRIIFEVVYPEHPPPHKIQAILSFLQTYLI